MKTHLYLDCEIVPELENVLGRGRVGSAPRGGRYHASAYPSSRSAICGCALA